MASLLTAKGARNARAGFTLVELMVALTGGLFVSLAVFALARDSGRFYQRESRVANATVSALLGFERLRMDIARAGFMSTPNITLDPAVCAKPNPNWPAGLRSLASVRINPAVAGGALAANGRNPPTLVLAGSYSSSDIFPARVTLGANGQVVFNLIPGSPALTRLGNGVNPDNPTVQNVFQANRGLRFVQYGKQYYGTIVASNGGPQPTVSVSATPPIQFRSGALGGCGAELIGSGAGEGTINVVNLIQYDVRSLSSNANYKSLYENSVAGPGEAQRTELVRAEQDMSGTVDPTSEEIVAEYAVDLGFQVTAVTSVSGCCDPTVALIASTTAAFGTFTGDVALPNVNPQRIRTVRVRLGVRSRESDRAAGMTADPTAGADRGIFRFNLGTSGGAEPFARVRTFQADVALYNQMDVLW